MKTIWAVLIAIIVVFAFAATANATATGMQITEWMYQGAAIGTVSDSEFMEFTNMGSTAVDLTGWYFSDSHRTNNDVSLAAFGVVGSGESIILTAADASGFRTAWGLASTVKVIGGNTQNLARSDEINLYNGATLVDRLTYNDQATPTAMGPRTQNKSCTTPVADLDLTSGSSSWTLASVGDAYGSWKSTGGDIGNPGHYYGAPAVPEPGSIVVLLGGIAGLAGLKLRRK